MNQCNSNYNSDLIKQIHAARRYALNGLIIFDYAHLSDNYVEVLTESVFRPLKKDIEIQEADVQKPDGIVQFKTKEKKRARRK